MLTLVHKRGDTFSYAGTVPLPAPDGAWHGAAQLRDRIDKDTATPVADLTVTVTPPVAPETEYGVLIEATSENAAAWPVKTLYCDIQFSDEADPPVVASTKTFAVKVQRDVTYD